MLGKKSRPERDQSDIFQCLNCKTVIDLSGSDAAAGWKNPEDSRRRQRRMHTSRIRSSNALPNSGFSTMETLVVAARA